MGNGKLLLWTEILVPVKSKLCCFQQASVDFFSDKIAVLHLLRNICNKNANSFKISVMSRTLQILQTVLILESLAWKEENTDVYRNLFRRCKASPK